MKHLKELQYLLDRTPLGNLKTLAKNLRQDKIISGIKELDDYIIPYFCCEMEFLRAFLKLEYGL